MSRITIGIIGLGYVGQTLLAIFSYHRYYVLGIDISEQVVSSLKRGVPTIYERKLGDYLYRAYEQRNYRVSSTYNELVDADLVFITIGTGLNSRGYMNLGALKKVARNLVPVLKRKTNQLVIVVKSTVLPGTTRRIFLDFLSRKKGFLLGNDFDVVVNPEFLREGNAIDDLENACMAVIGSINKSSGDFIEDFWQEFYGKVGHTPIYVRTNIETAELIKLVINAFLATKISFANKIADLCERIPNTDVGEVMRIVGLDPRISPHFFKAGLGFGGSCLPKDLRALIAFGRELGVDMNILESVFTINNRRSLWVLDILRKFDINRGSKILILGLSFKPETNDIRGSIGVNLAKILVQEGYSVHVYDPIAMDNAKIVLRDMVTYIDRPNAIIKSADAIIIATEWQEFRDCILKNLGNLKQNAIIIDGRRLLTDFIDRLRKSKVRYIPIGKKP